MGDEAAAVCAPGGDGCGDVAFSCGKVKGIARDVGGIELLNANAVNAAGGDGIQAGGDIKVIDTVVELRKLAELIECQADLTRANKAGQCIGSKAP